MGGPPLDRRGLAQWVTDPKHPLTARVAVNRFWGNFFAAPLVRTPENFGSQGELPTHPQLLDWMARDFIEIQLTPEERSLLLRYGYPFEQIEQALKACESSCGIEIAPWILSSWNA